MSKQKNAAFDANEILTLTSPQLIIFDCDGVLVDSEVIGSRVVSAAFSENGFSISPEEVSSRYTGISSEIMFADIEARFGKPLPAHFSIDLQRRLLSTFDRELEAIAGIETALQSLQCKICVASSSNLERIRFSLSRVGLIKYFEPYIFSSTQVAHGKPAPDLFLLAANEMQISPRFCWVVEDSVAGVRAAVAAGMNVLGFTGGSHFSSRTTGGTELMNAGAITIFGDMSKLDKLVANSAAN